MSPLPFVFKDHRENVKLVLMLQHVVHTQYGWHLTACNGITSVQTIWLYFMVILLRSGYRFTYLLLRLWKYGLHGSCLQVSRGQCQGQVGWYQLVYMNAISHSIFTQLKSNILKHGYRHIYKGCVCGSWHHSILGHVLGYLIGNQLN